MNHLHVPPKYNIQLSIPILTKVLTLLSCWCWPLLSRCRCWLLLSLCRCRLLFGSRCWSLLSCGYWGRSRSGRCVTAATQTAATQVQDAAQVGSAAATVFSATATLRTRRKYKIITCDMSYPLRLHHHAVNPRGNAIAMRPENYAYHSRFTAQSIKHEYISVAFTAGSCWHWFTKAGGATQPLKFIDGPFPYRLEFVAFKAGLVFLIFATALYTYPAAATATE